MKALAVKLVTELPDAFPGDALALMQFIYKDTSLPLALRLDAAAKAARFERPTLGATAVEASVSVSTVGSEERHLARARLFAELADFAKAEPLESPPVKVANSEQPGRRHDSQRHTGLNYPPPPDEWP